MHWFLTVALQWCLFPVSLSGQLVAGRRKAYGWLLGLGTQVLWAAYALAIHQPGMLVGTSFYAAAYAWNWYSWQHPAGAAHVLSRLRRRPVAAAPAPSGSET